MAGTLAKLAAFGYRTVESAGMAEKTAADFRKALDAAGLKCPSSFEEQTDPEKSVSAVFHDKFAAIGLAVVGISSSRTPRDFQRRVLLPTSFHGDRNLF